MRSAFLAPSAIAIGASIWGVYWIPLRALDEAGIAGAWAVVLFNLPALIGAGLILLIWSKRGAEDARAAVLAGLLAGAGLALYAMGLVFTSVVRATLLFYLTPVWSTLIAIFVLAERPGPARIAALILALGGLCLILGLNPSDLTAGLGLGEILGFASGFFWGWAAVLIRKSGHAGPQLTFYQFLGVVSASAIGALLLGDAPPRFQALEAALSPLVIALSLAILLSVYVIFWALAQMSPGRGGLLMMTEVVVAVGSAAILLPQEALTGTEWAGAALILAAGFCDILGGEVEQA